MRCEGTKSDGSPCERMVGDNVRWCWNHDPVHARQRRELASHAAKSKRDPQITELNSRVREVLDQTLTGEVDRADASVFFQGAGVLIRGIEQARKVRETDELEQRVADLQQRMRGTGG